MSKYQPEPLYGRKDSKYDLETNPVIPKLQFWTGTKTYGHSQSQLLTWCLQEEAKKERGEYNERDMNLIIAASKGFTNAWSNKVKENTIFFNDFILAFRKQQNAELVNFWSEAKGMS